MGISLDNDRHYNKWIGLVRDALSCLDLKKYNWLHLPNSGGYYEQDDFFITIWNYIRYEYVKAMKDESFLNSTRKK